MPRTALAMILEERGISQAELRYQTGLARQTITEAVYGRPISMETAVRIAKALDVPLRLISPLAAEDLDGLIVA